MSSVRAFKALGRFKVMQPTRPDTSCFTNSSEFAEGLITLTLDIALPPSKPFIGKQGGNDQATTD